MKDNLKDLIQHVQLEGVDLIKVLGTDKETKVAAVAEDKSVIVYGTFKNPIADFIGTFGMPNLGKLKTILGIDEYRENAKITVNTQVDTEGKRVPSGIHFENAAGDFKNDYRYMDANVINDKLKTVKFKGVAWGVDFVPTVAGIQRLRMQAAANSEETTFTAKTENGDLKFYFGDHSTHAGNFVFQSDVGGSITGKNFSWPVKEFIGIMDLVGDKTIRVSDAGATEIVVDSGIATYRYLLPANVK